MFPLETIEKNSARSKNLYIGLKLHPRKKIGKVRFKSSIRRMIPEASKPTSG